MKRRDVWAAAATLVSPHCGSAATARTRVFRVGVLGDPEFRPEASEWKLLVDELGKQGYVLNRNLEIEGMSASGIGLNAAAAALIALKVDVICAMGTQPAMAAQQATSVIPIVFQSADPVGFGLVSSLARPQSNLTGVSIQGPAITSKEIEYLAEALGTLKSLTYIQPNGTRSLPWYKSYVAAATSAAASLGIQIEFVDVAGSDGYEPLIRKLVGRGVDAAALVDGGSAVSPTEAEYKRIAGLLLRYRLPAIGPARLGFLLQCEFSADLLTRRVAYFVGRILRGTKPAELPVEEFSTLQVVLNLRTAGDLGVKIPRSLLIRADEVID